MQSAKEFWVWFLEKRELLGRTEAASKAVEELRDRLSNLDITDWEVGPFDETGETSYLALSPTAPSENGLTNRAALLERTPPEGWVTLPFKPPKQWDRRIGWGTPQTIVDANHWNFEVYRYDDGKFDVVLVTQISEFDSLDDRRSLLLAVLEFELGEAGMAERLNAVDISVATSAINSASLIPIDQLKQLILAGIRKI